MGLFNRKKSVEQLQEEGESLTIEEENSSRRANIAEKEAVIRQLKERYGSGWQKTLGVNKLTDLGTLKGFLRSANQGLKNQASHSSGQGTPLQEKVTSFKGLPRA